MLDHLRGEYPELHFPGTVSDTVLWSMGEYAYNDNASVLLETIWEDKGVKGTK